MKPIDPGVANRLLLINPNTNTSVTEVMGTIARDELDRSGLSRRLQVFTRTARRGARLITDERALNEAAAELINDAGELDLAGVFGVIIAAFGDPALNELRERLAIPVTGLAEAAMAQACRAMKPGGHFAVVTTTPALVDSIVATAWRYGHADHFAGVELTPGDPADLMAEPAALEAAMQAACERAIRRRGASALVIGGGPLAQVAIAIAPRLPVPVVSPIPAAVQLAVHRAHLA